MVGDLVAVAGNDGLIRLNGQEEKTLRGHQDKVTALKAFKSKGGWRLLSGSGNGESQVMLWDLETGKVMQIYQGHSAQLTCMIPISTEFFCSGSYDNYAMIWKIDQSDPVITLDKHKAVVSCLEYQKKEHILLVGSFDKSISIWRLSFDEQGIIVNFQFL